MLVLNCMRELLVRWNVISEGQLNEGSAIGGAVGGALGSLIPIPGFGTWLGTFLGSLAGSLIGGVFGDEDFPRAAYLVQLLHN